MEQQYCFAWWNLENLFDVDGALDRPEWLQKELKGELKEWNATALMQKLSQIAQVITAMNNGAGPDLIGVCEIESRAVLEKLVASLNLPSRNYDIIHEDTQDKRGIDVAFIYDTQQFDVETDAGSGKKMIFSHLIQKRSATRDIVQVNLVSKQGEPFIVIGNHWPSRMGGELESEPYRMIAGETLAYFMQRIQELRKDVPVFVMGDFNDEPFNRSMSDYALSTHSRSKVTRARSRPMLLNLMWRLMDGSRGTHSYGNVWGMLDQVLLNKGALKKEGLYCKPEDINIFTIPGMVDGNKIVRHGRPCKKKEYNPNGFSDHLPVTFLVREKIS